MSIKTISGRVFNQNVSEAKRAAVNGPVFITDRGRPAHVLLTIESYQSLIEKGSIVDMLAMPDSGDIDFNAPRLGKVLYHPADLT